MIDYARIGRSIDFYSLKGFQRVEAPWTVTKAVSDATRPRGAPDWTITEKGKVLVASAEQGFLYMLVKGMIPTGFQKLQSVTPCFRDEPFDFSHVKYFVKNELFVTGFDPGDEDDLIQQVMGSAREFFTKELGGENVRVVREGRGFDLEVQEVEVGSYGFRQYEGHRWIYGTGLAEPRFSGVVRYLEG